MYHADKRQDLQSLYFRAGKVVLRIFMETERSAYNKRFCAMAGVTSNDVTCEHEG